MAEWEYFDNKIPGAYLSNVGVPGGHIHTWGLTLEPTYNFKTSGHVGWLRYRWRRVLSPGHDFHRP